MKDDSKDLLIDTRKPEEIKIDEILEQLKEIKRRVDILALEH